MSAVPLRAALIAAGAVILAIGAAGFWIATASGADDFAGCREGGGTVGSDIGGPFTLTRASDGARVTASEVIDRPTLVYFGYTFCPDFCPLDASFMAEAARLLAEERGVDVKTVFVTIDPERDSREVLQAFTGAMHPEMIGLRGSAEDVAEAARAYRVYYARAGEEDDPYYLMDHSTFTYLMAPEVGFLDFFRHGTPPEDIAERTACYVDKLG
jgi:protein SCO1/2